MTRHRLKALRPRNERRVPCMTTAGAALLSSVNNESLKREKKIKKKKINKIK